MLQEEGGDLFDSRSVILGHTMQGGFPSPMDRARGVRMSLHCMASIERYHDMLQAQTSKTKQLPPESIATVAIKGTSTKWVPVQEMQQWADVKGRRGQNPWWLEIKEVVDALVARSEFTA